MQINLGFTAQRYPLIPREDGETLQLNNIFIFSKFFASPIQLKSYYFTGYVRQPSWPLLTSIFSFRCSVQVCADKPLMEYY